MIYLDSCIVMYAVEQAAELRAAHRLKTPDALHVAAAAAGGYALTVDR